MTFDNTVTLGNLFSIGAFLIGLWVAAARTYHSLDKRATIFEKTVLDHSALLESHSKRMEKQDDLLLRISGDMQRIVGRLEAINPGAVADAAAAAISVVRAAEIAAMNTVAAAAAAAATLRNAKEPL